VAFNYSGNPASSERDEVRFLLGDTVAPGYLQDAEIDWLLAQTGGNVTSAVAGAMQQIAAQFAAKAVDQTTGRISTEFSARAAAWEERLRRWLADNGTTVLSFTPMPRAGGISEAAKTAQEQDTDRIPPAIRRGMHDDPRVGDESAWDELRHGW